MTHKIVNGAGLGPHKSPSMTIVLFLWTSDPIHSMTTGVCYTTLFILTLCPSGEKEEEEEERSTQHYDYHGYIPLLTFHTSMQTNLKTYSTRTNQFYEFHLPFACKSFNFPVFALLYLLFLHHLSISLSLVS